MAEQEIQGKILKMLKNTEACYAVKVMAANRNGVPDIIGCYRGRFIAIEVKQKGNKPTDLQLANITQIKESGGFACVAYDQFDVLELLGEVNEAISSSDSSSD